MKRLWWMIILVVLLLSGCIVGWVWSKQQQDLRKYNRVSINIHHEGNDDFLLEKDILNYLNKAQINPTGKYKNQIKTSMIEHELDDLSYVEKAHVYSELSDNIRINIKQRVPFVRVSNALGEQFYIDKTGVCIPLDNEHTSRILIANGNIFYRFEPDFDVNKKNSNGFINPLLHEIYEVASFIEKDEFLSAQIEQIYINKDREIELIPKIGNQTILLGDTSLLADKMKRLRYFYRYGIPKAGWNKYALINLKYKNQVICTKR